MLNPDGESKLSWRVVWLVALLLALSDGAAAQSAEPYEASDADVVYRQGMELYDKGEYGQACALIEKSLRLDYGMAAHFRLAECYEKLGHTASAHESYREVLDKAREAEMAERVELVEERLEKLKPRLSKLQILVPGDVAELPGFALTLADKALTPADYNQPRPVNPGIYQLRASADEHHPWQHEVTISGPGMSTVNVPTLRSTAEPAPPSPSPAGETSTTAYVGMAVAGAGLAAAIVGGVLALVGKGKYDGTIEDFQCLENRPLCSEEGGAIREDANALGIGGAVLIGVGAAALVTGVVLWATAPDDVPSSDTAYLLLAPAGAGAQLVAGATW